MLPAPNDPPSIETPDHPYRLSFIRIEDIRISPCTTYQSMDLVVDRPLLAFKERM